MSRLLNDIANNKSKGCNYLVIASTCITPSEMSDLQKEGYSVKTVDKFTIRITW